MPDRDRMPKAALYARVSTDMQSAASIPDQLAACRKLAQQLGAQILGEFDDAAISGQAMANRPGLQALLTMARARAIDLVICEHTDRLSRSLADTPAIYEDLRALGVRIWTVNQGEVGTIHVGMSATMSALLIEDIAKKTRRGLAGVVRSGRAAGGCPYGYQVPRAYDADGERIRGLRDIDEAEAEVVRRIFLEYASGSSPLAIATGLNAEGVPGPRGGGWKVTTIHGSAQAASGILRNELYRGVRVWGRNSMVKDRQTGKRRPLYGQFLGGELERQDAPELRIIDEPLWARVQQRLAAQSVGPQGQRSGQRRPKALLGGLIRCGQCGGPMSRGGSGDHLRCNVRASEGAGRCTNTRTPSYGDIEQRVLASVQANLLHPDVIAAAVDEFRKAMAEEQREAVRDQAAAHRELAEVTRRADRLIQQVEDGMPWQAVAERHGKLTARKAELEDQLAKAEPKAQVITLHPTAAGMYRQWVTELQTSLQDLEHRQAPEARERIRALVSEVRFLPRTAKGQFELEFDANLAPILNLDGAPALMRATNSRSCVVRSHEWAPVLRLAG